MMSFRAVMGETLPLPQQLDSSNESQMHPHATAPPMRLTLFPFVVFLSRVYFIHRGENEGTLAAKTYFVQICMYLYVHPCTAKHLNAKRMECSVNEEYGYYGIYK